MSPSASEQPVLPSRPQIENWATSHLTEAARLWRASASESDGMFAQHRANIENPGGTEWEGDAKDAALDRVTTDATVVRNQADVIVTAADIAENGVADIQAAQRQALEAIEEAEADGFKVGDDLSVRDTRRVDLSDMAARHAAAKLHAEDIRWNAERLVAADAFVSQRLEAKATELESLTFHGEGHDTTVQAVGWGPWKQDPEIPAPPPTPSVPGLPPPGISPPVSGPLTVGPPSRSRPRRMGEMSLWDEKGGEWRYYAGDKWHNPHWDYHSGPKAPWDNVPINNLPVHTPEAKEKAPKPAPTQAPAPKAPVEAPAPNPAPADPPPAAPKAPVEIPPPKIGRGPIVGGGSAPMGPEVVPFPHSEHHIPVLGEDQPGQDF